MNNVPHETMDVNPSVLLCVRAATSLLAEDKVAAAKELVEHATKMEPDNTTLQQLLQEITVVEEKIKSKTQGNNLPLKTVAVNRTPAPAPANYIINDGNFWDNYVKKWKMSDKNKDLKYLGNEWRGEDIFISLLQRYSDPSLSALEIGCGGGRITSDAVKWFKHLYATDVSYEMLTKCREDVRENNISFHQSDGFTLDEFREGSIDTVYSHDVFVHFSALQVYPYFQEAKRILKKGGVGIVSFYNYAVHFGLFKEMSAKLYHQKKYPAHMRVHFITEEIIRIMLKDLGMEVVEIDSTNFLIVVFRKIDG